MTDWTKRFLDLAGHVALWSKDPSTKVGCVIVDHHRRVVGLGYNGFPRDVLDRPERYENREVKYKMVVHAEANAILNATVPVRDFALFATQFPCTECTKLIIQSGISRVFAPKLDESSKWYQDSLISKQMMAEAAVVWSG